MLEDGYAAVLRHNGIPVAAASFHVFGPDHARIQVGFLVAWLAVMSGIDCLGWMACLISLV